MENNFDAVGGVESDSYCYLEDYSDNNSKKEVDYEIPELILEQVDNDLWQDCVENMFRNILEKQINKLIECNLPKEIMEQVLVLKENFKRKVCTQDLEERLYNICKQICKLDAQYYS